MKPEHMLQALSEANDAIDLKKLAPTESIENWIKCKEYWMCLDSIFKNFFSGNYIFKDIKLNEETKHLMELSYDKYLSLYNLLQLGWLEIKEAHKEVQMPVRKPGEALIYIMKNQAREAWERRLERPNTQAVYLLYRQSKKCEELGSQVTSTDLEKLNKLYKRVTKNLPTTELSESTKFLNICVEICASSKKKNIRDSANIFKKKSGDLNDWVGKADRASY